MKRLFSKIGLVGIITMSIVTSFNFSAQAEKKKIMWTYKWGKPEKMSTLSPNDIPGHLLVQFERRDTITSTDPEWNGTEQLMHAQGDEIAGTGTGFDYGTQLFKSGDVAYFKLDAAWTGTYKENGDWVGTVEGILRYMGGTGKYKSIRGSAAVHCKSVDGGCTLEGEVEY